MSNAKQVFLIVFFIAGSLVSGAQVTGPDGYINNGGTVSKSSGQLIASVAEPVTGLLKDGWQHCLQGFVYKTIANDFSTSIDEPVILPQVTISLYPNPATDYVNVVYDKDNYDEMSYSIYAENGRLVKNGTLDGRLTQINVQAFSPATYVFILSFDAYGDILNRTKIVKL